MQCAHCHQSSHKECVVKMINKSLFTEPVAHPTDEKVQTLINPFNIPGVHYLCKACDKKLLPNTDKEDPTNTEKVDPTSAVTLDTTNSDEVSK